MTRTQGNRSWKSRVLAVASWALIPVLLFTLAVLLVNHLNSRLGWPMAVPVGLLIGLGVWALSSLLVRKRVRSGAEGRDDLRPGPNAAWQLPVRIALVLLLVQASLLAVDAAALSYRHGVPFSESAKAVTREAGLTGIRAAVAVADPYEPRLAGTGPDLGPRPDAAGLVRVEHLPGEWFTLREVHNETIVRCGHGFRYQPYDEPRLQELRRRYRLDEVVAPAADEFEAQVLLRGWARSQFRRQDYQPAASDFDALEILDRNLRNDSGEPYDPGRHIDPCHFFPMLYCQVLVSMGHQARLVSIGHGMTEVWSNQYRKWVLMDAELNWHYEKDGVPQNMVEVFEENFADGPPRLRVVRGRQTSDPNTTMVYLGKEEVPVDILVGAHRTHLVIVDMRNDWLTNRYFRGHPARSELNSLVYLDPRLDLPVPFGERLRPRTASKDEFYWTLNQTEIHVRKPVRRDSLDLVFSTVTPNFQGFEVVVDGGPPATTASPEFRWPLHEGENTLSVRTVNQAGVRGVVSSVKLVVPPPGR